MKKIFFVIFLMPFLSHGQKESRVKIDTHGLMELILNTPGEVVVNNADVYFDSNLLAEFTPTTDNTFQYDSAGRIIISKGIKFQNSTVHFYSRNIAASSLWFTDSEVKTFWYENGSLITPKGSRMTEIFIEKSFLEDFKIIQSAVSINSFDSHYSASSIKISKSKVRANFNVDDLNNLIIENCSIRNISLYHTSVGSFKCIDNRILNEILEGGEYGSIEISKNELDNLVLANPTIKTSLLIQNNSIKVISLKTSLEDYYFDIDWQQLKGSKLRHAFADGPVSHNEIAFVSPTDSSVVLHKEKYFPIIEVYSKLIARYKTLGRLEDSNSAFTEFKDLEGARYYELYQSKGGINNYFRWKLNRLMKFYTEHGTDPARAIIISLYVIIAFGFFYVFFPSDWDTISKSKLIQNFNDFRTKNEKGYVKSFLILLIGLFIGLLNAFTLSLNAFTTLGFGNIPTNGIARYVCVLEGFIGWFLLSIFSVALINQVLV